MAFLPQEILAIRRDVLLEAAEVAARTLQEAAHMLPIAPAPVRKWSKDRPTEPGWWWCWQPADQFPCRGKACAVLVERESHQGLVAWVPYMDYSDPLDLNTWDDSWWMPEVAPEPPEA